MPRPSLRRRSDDEEPEEDEDDQEDEEEEEEEEEPAPRRRGRPSSRRGRRPAHRPPVRRWQASEEEEEEEEEGRPSGRRPPPPSGRKPIYWRARDSLFFEPLVAFAIIVVLLVSLYAYTQNWPPIYVVESNSMQHGSNDQLGLINTGDLVLAQKVSLSSITPYVTGLQTGYSTYGEYGDVLLYWPNGGGSTPIIHRALFYLDWNPVGGFYNATDLSGLPCGTASNAVFAYYLPLGSAPTCRTTDLALGGTIDLYRIGWTDENVSIPLTTTLGDHSGFITMGDANLYTDQTAPVPFSTLVEPGWVIGVARGMIPWFGALKLLLEGQTSEVPAQSWQFMALTIVGVILLAYGIHYALRTEGVETPLRREEEREAHAEEEAAAALPESGPRRWFSFLHRKPAEGAEEEESTEKVSRRTRTRPPPSSPPLHRGRPVPRVRRPAKPPKKRRSDEEL